MSQVDPSYSFQKKFVKYENDLIAVAVVRGTRTTSGNYL